jgi:S-adenosylmethionine-diacylglycerol 3-amino-3-carboxypropyl transferase
MPSEVEAAADFSLIRYAQVWEDADVLLEGLDIRSGDTCLAIASAGDNALAMLARNPHRVVAIDLNPAQLVCLELRIAAYQRLEHGEMLELIGSRPSKRRPELYARCRDRLSAQALQFWDRRPRAIWSGIGCVGKFERYFEIFRRAIVPLIHSRQTVDRLLAGGALAQRRRFYREQWDTLRWRLLFQIFFSRFTMGKLGRDPAFFNYVQGNVSARILERSRHALCELNPAENPYLQWILKGRHTTALPFALRPENFDSIRNNLHRLEWRLCSLEEYLDGVASQTIDRFNLSDIFEYMSPENYHRALQKIVRTATPGGRIVYWNMLAPRSRPDSMANALHPLDELAQRLHLHDKAFFYSAIVVEEILGGR